MPSVRKYAFHQRSDEDEVVGYRRVTVESKPGATYVVIVADSASGSEKSFIPIDEAPEDRTFSSKEEAFQRAEYLASLFLDGGWQSGRG